MINTEVMSEHKTEFYVTASVDCPMKGGETNGTIYHLITWEIEGSLSDYLRPTPTLSHSCRS